MFTLLGINLIAAVAGSIYAAVDIGNRLGRATNRKLLGNKSPYAEVITVAKGSKVVKKHEDRTLAKA